MPCRYMHRLAAGVVVLIAWSFILPEAGAQYNNQELCRRQCRLSTQYYSRYDYSSTFLNNYLSTCYSRCPQGGSQRQTTSPPFQRTSTPAYYQNQNCGVQPTFRNRVVGGYDAGECEFPWMVSVTIDSLFCGGSILDSRHILTAAHCLRNKYTGAVVSAYQVNVRVGSSELSRLRVYSVQRVMVDSRHVPVINDYDVAVLRLTEDMTFSSCVSPICLPQVLEDPRRADYCAAAGWGVEDYNSQSLSYSLKKVTLPIVDNSVCAQSYGTNYVNSLKICAGDFNRGGIDTCQGDSGGPLMCKFGNRFTVMGIVSFGSGCARPRYPGIYTRVAHESILNFIRQSSRSY